MHECNPNSWPHSGNRKRKSCRRRIYGSRQCAKAAEYMQATTYLSCKVTF